jgi:arylformamidase
VAAGSAVAVLNYDLAPRVTVGEIVRQVCAALVWCHGHAEQFGGDPERLYVSGHSAGGHLTAIAMTHDWSGVPDVPDDLVKGGCAISGLFDLEPIRLCYLNEDVRLDEAAARAQSPIHRIALGRGPLIVAVGGAETEEFLRHSAEFAGAWEKRGNPSMHMELPGLTHFSVLDALATAEGALTQAILAQMGLTQAG